MSLDQGLLDEFAIEANELLDEAEEALLKVDHEADIKKMYDLVFRTFHSLKGSSGMVGFDELQRHLHLLEDYLQKSKGDFDHFRASADYYLKGVDAARKILGGETVQFVYEVMGPKKTALATDAPVEVKKKKIIYLSNSRIKPLGEEILGFEGLLHFYLKFSSVDELENQNLFNEEYDVLISDLSLSSLSSIISPKKSKYPLILIVDEIIEEKSTQKIFQLMKKSDERLRIQLALESALDARMNIDLFEKAKGLVMYMYSDLEEYLIEKNKVDIQKVLSAEIRSFVKNYSR